MQPHRPALGLQGCRHAIAPFPVHLPQLLGPFGRLLQGSDRSGLQGQGLVEIHHPLQLAQGRDQPLGADRKGEPVAPQAPAL